jgi:hypothetical protein
MYASGAAVSKQGRAVVLDEDAYVASASAGDDTPPNTGAYSMFLGPGSGVRGESDTYLTTGDV